MKVRPQLKEGADRGSPRWRSSGRVGQSGGRDRVTCECDLFSTCSGRRSFRLQHLKVHHSFSKQQHDFIADHHLSKKFLLPKNSSFRKAHSSKHVNQRMPAATSLIISSCFVLALCTHGALTLSDDGPVYLRRTLNALENALDFFDEEKDHLNLDALIGTRIVEGQLKVVLDRVDSGDLAASEDILVQLRRVRGKADAVSDAATPNIQKTQPLYFSRIGTILGPEFWVLDYKSRDVNKSLILPQHMKGEAMHEDDSDDCLTELFGTGTSPGSSTTPCRVSRKCWDLMTSPSYRSYSLSHEVFYLQIGQLFGCFRENMLPVLDKLNAGFCANLYQEALEIAKADYPEDRRDFFMEIPALCGMVGYRQFFRDDWLERMLSWQWTRGCWGGEVKHHHHLTRNSLDRFKREEKQLPDGCECHRTAVAIGALSQYVRFILEYLNLPADQRES